MCWTITIGTGKSAGSIGRMEANAFGPPVDEPMATMSIRFDLVAPSTRGRTFIRSNEKSGSEGSGGRVFVWVGTGSLGNATENELQRVG